MYNYSYIIIIIHMSLFAPCVTLFGRQFFPLLCLKDTPGTGQGLGIRSCQPASQSGAHPIEPQGHCVVQKFVRGLR